MCVSMHVPPREKHKASHISSCWSQISILCWLSHHRGGGIGARPSCRASSLPQLTKDERNTSCALTGDRTLSCVDALSTGTGSVVLRCGVVHTELETLENRSKTCHFREPENAIGPLTAWLYYENNCKMMKLRVVVLSAVFFLVAVVVVVVLCTRLKEIMMVVVVVFRCFTFLSSYTQNRLITPSSITYREREGRKTLLLPVTAACAEGFWAGRRQNVMMKL